MNRTKQNAQQDLLDQVGRVAGCKSLTMSYFHTGVRTIIGAKSFHCPVRDGKEWYQLAMVIRHKGLAICTEQITKFIELIQFFRD